MDKLISELFFELQTNLPESGNFGVKTLPFSDKVLLGISPEGNPIFFIEKEFENNTKDIKLALISALFIIIFFSPYIYFFLFFLYFKLNY